MKTKELVELAGDPRFISGIYNYCDRWCERCNFTSRCLTYEQLPESSKSDDPAAHDLNNAKFWEELREIFKETREMIELFAAEQGIDLKSVEAETAIEDHRDRRKSAREEKLTRMAEQYIHMAMEWLKSEGNDLEEAAQFDEALQDAIEIIRWYQFMPAVKIARGFMRNDLGIEEDPIQNDSNGSVKVALIAIDRSIAAWGRLKSFMPEKAEGILPILARLETLRRHTELAFPNARDFIRPGFDEVAEYLM
ncbi:MAG: hypothetical protein MOB07_10385 [Acidobacteria bacterium]|nr:hypothetical protein [Acidobacteriota bacterium]